MYKLERADPARPIAGGHDAWKVNRGDIILITDGLLEEALSWHFEEDDLSIIELEQCAVGDVLIYDVRRPREKDWITDLIENREVGADWEVVPIMLGELVRRKSIRPAIYAVIVPEPVQREWRQLNPWST